MLRRCLLLTLLVTGAAAAPASAAITVSSPTVAEGGELTFTVQRSILDPVATAATADGTATAPADYTPVSGRSIVGLSTDVTVATAADTAPEMDETVLLVVTPAGGGTPVTGTGTITDDDPPAVALFDARAPEGAGAIDIIVARTPVSRATRLGYSVAAGSATAIGDFQPVAGELTVPANADRATIRIPVVEDAVDEEDETITVVLTTTSDPAAIARASGTATIVNDDLRTLTVSDVPTVEGDGSDTIARVPVSLSGQTFRTVTVQYATVALTAKAPGDYTTRVGTLTIPAGQQQGFVDVPITADDKVEKAERFAVLVGRESGARVVRGTALVAIADDDAAAGDDDPPAMRVTRPAARGRTLAVRVTCPRGERRCTGRVTFFSRPDRRAKARLLRSERRIGARSFSLAGGRTATVRVRLSRRLAAAARRSGRLKVRAYVVAQDANDNSDTAAASATLKLRR